MRRLIASLLVVMGAAPAATASRTVEQTRIAACSLLPRDLVAKVMPRTNKAFLDMKPHEEQIGQTGSSCDYADIHLQVDPFARPEQLRKSPGKDWQPVTGLGDTAYFHDNSGRFAELMVWTGAHHFTIQLGVSYDETVEKAKPNALALANAIIPKLK